MPFDKYVYPGTDILINSRDYRDKDALARFEADVVMVQFEEMLRYGVPGDFSPEWYCSIHREMFSRVYPWAGDFRDIRIFKPGEIEYASPAFLEQWASSLFGDLVKAQGYCGLERAEFIATIARFMGDLHVLHPFREGNTRTLQVATAEIAYRAGHSLAWNTADPESIRAAGNAAAGNNFSAYERILTEICGERQVR